MEAVEIDVTCHLYLMNQDNEFDNNKLTNLDSVSVIGNRNSDNELVNKKYLDDELDKNTVLRFNQTVENYLKVTVGNDTYNFNYYDKIQITDTTEIEFPNIDGDLLQKWNIKCNNKYNDSKVGNFIKQQKQTVLQVIQGRPLYLQLVQRLCISKLVQKTMVVIIFLFLLKELI